MALESASEASASEALKAADAARVEAEEKSEWNLKKLRKAIEKGKGIERDKVAFQRRVEELESDVSRLEADAATARAAESAAAAARNRRGREKRRRRRRVARGGDGTKSRRRRIPRRFARVQSRGTARGGGGGANLRVGG